ncbi:MAG TPA: hypothetical protein VGQ85_01105 [Candidatus Limnocylindrales bacterium]|nr:hypothetical protein [Candidatus Limnocylindrales bacterium]
MTDETTPEAATPPERGPGAEQPPYPSWDPERFGDLPGREPGDLIPSLSPRQVLGGFVLLAAAVVVLRRLGRSRPDSRG